MGLEFVTAKKENLIIADKFRRAGLEKDYVLLSSCATYVSYKNFADSRALHLSNFCKSKFCPICNRINAYKQKRKMRDFLKKYDFAAHEHYHLIFTLEDCGLNCIKKTIKIIKSAWAKMIRRVNFKKKILYYSYYVHVKYNAGAREDKAYNVHLHVIGIYNNNIAKSDITCEHEAWENGFYKTFCRKKEKSGYSIDYKPVVLLNKIETPKHLVNLVGYCARGIDVVNVPVKDLAELKRQLTNVNLMQSSQHLGKLLRDQERKKKKIVRLPYYISVTIWSDKRYEDAYAYDPITYNTIVD